MTSTTQRNWILIAMFAVGFFTGAAVVAGLAWKYAPPRGMPSGTEIVDHLRQEMRSELHLTPEQAQQLEPALERHRAELDHIRETTLSNIYRSIVTKNDAVKQVLTPEQRTAFESNEKERLKRFGDPAAEPR